MARPSDRGTAALQLVLLLLVVIVECVQDHYRILGVQRGASKAMIKRAYRKLAIKYHPDKRPNDKKANQRFAKINTAYETLSNPEKRRKYDAGESDMGQGGYGGGGGGFGQAKETVEQKLHKSEDVEVMEDNGTEEALGKLRSRAKRGFWLLFFFDDDNGDSERLVDHFVDAARTFHGMVKVLAIRLSDEHADSSPLAKLMGLEKTGAILVYNPQNKGKPIKFKGEASMVQISQFAANEVPYNGVIVRDHTSLTRFLIKDESRPKFFLITEKWSVPLIFKLLALELSSIVTFGVCRGESSGQQFLRRYKPIKAGHPLPVLLYFKNADAKPEHYQGRIASKDIQKYLLGKIGPYQGVTVADHNSFTRFLIRNDQRAKVLLITSREDIPALWRSLSNTFKDRVDFAACRVIGAQSNSFIMKRFKVTQVPRILFFKNGDSKPVVYDGSSTVEALSTFINKKLWS